MKFIFFVLLCAILSACNYENLDKKLNGFVQTTRYLYEISNSDSGVKDTLSIEIYQKYSLLKETVSIKNDRNTDNLSQNKLINKKLKEYITKNFFHIYYFERNKAMIFNLSSFNINKESLEIPLIKNVKIEEITIKKSKNYYHLVGSEIINNNRYNAKYTYSIEDGFTNITFNNHRNYFNIKLIKISKENK